MTNLEQFEEIAESIVAQIANVANREDIRTAQDAQKLDIVEALKEAYTMGELQASKAVEALRLVAAPKRADGTYNRDREACEKLAKEVLKQLE